MKKGVGIALTAILAIGLVAAVVKSFNNGKQAETAPEQTQQASSQVQIVKVLTGSAKFAFLQDPEVVQILESEGIQLELTKSGAFESDAVNIKQYDAVWPAGSNAASDFTRAYVANKIQPKSFPIFSTPLTIASWKALLPTLKRSGMVVENQGHYDLKLSEALPFMLAGKRWNQLPDNTAFAVNKSFLVNTSDIRNSNTAALYIATLAYMQNKEEVPQNQQTALALADDLAPVILRQGFQEETLSGPFDDYLGVGMGKAPLVLVYESQFVDAKRQNKIKDSQILLYPQPGMVTKHVLLSRTSNGAKLGELLASNPKIQAKAAQYGFRINDPEQLKKTWAEFKMQAPELLNLGEAPDSKLLDSMVKAIVAKMN